MSTDQVDLSTFFHPRFTGGRKEKEWLVRSLGDFYADEWFTDVRFRVKGGKEATVYCCGAHPSTGADLIAAKVFRPRMFRAMRNDALYKQGREFLDESGKLATESRQKRALQKKSKYGRFLDSASWCQHEVKTLETLFGVGVDVPRVITSSTNAILMAFVGDETQGAPILHGLSLERDEAEKHFERLLRNVQRMLECYVVHGDLSAYNVLYWDGDVTIIDLPQAIDALRHPAGFELFARDMHHLCAFFQKQGLELDAFGLALDLWQNAYG